MALLNEEQINDILDIANVCSSSTSAKKLIEWNEKQTTQQVNLDWSKAPIDAVKASISITWTTPEGYTETYSLGAYTKPVTPHPHAEMMAKYAEVAARRVDPWVEFEGKIGDADALILWQPLKYNPAWLDHIEYRYIGDDK